MEDNEDQEIGGPEIEMQNTFYVAEDAKRVRPAEAIEIYETVVVLSESIGNEGIKYRFDSYKNIVVLSAQLKMLDKMILNQQHLLKMVSKVTREDISEAVNAVLDSVANNLNDHPDI
jgi:hypothetical protein